jgi:hypothetical protein
MNFVYMNLYKEAKRPDGLVLRYQGKDGKTLFKLNPKRRALRTEKAAKAEKPKPKRGPRKRGSARTLEASEAAKDQAAELLERAAEADTRGGGR